MTTRRPSSARPASAPPACERLSAGAARRIALAAQGLADEPPAERAGVDRRHVRRVFRQVGVVQLDSVNVVARAHELTIHARLRNHDRSLPWRLQADGEVFEYWGHEASLVPVGYQPLLRWRMAQADGGAWGGLVRLARERPAYVAQVLEEVRERGPLTTGELSDPGSRSAAWWGWNQGKMALEYLFWSGQVAARRRWPSFERVYDVPERMIPAEVLARPTPDPADAQRELLALAARFCGVATGNDLADYFRLNKVAARPLLADLVEEGRLVPVEVEGWDQPAYLDPGARRPRRARGRALLAPFDSLVWCRERTERIFGFRLRVELYTPAAKRVHGYYVLPFLLGDALVARVDLKADRKAGVLRVPAAWGEPGIDTGEVCVALRHELSDLAEWLGLGDIDVQARGDLSAALRDAGVVTRRSGAGRLCRMHPGLHAQTTPDKAAVIMAGSGEVLSYRELDERSNRLAQLLWAAGLRPGDHLAIFAENHPRFFEVFWAAARSGLYFTTVNRYLQAEEAAYIVNDCGATAFVASHEKADVAAEIVDLIPDCPLRLMWDGTVAGYECYEDRVAEHPAQPLERQPRGEVMLYSSGTTGRPKGIKRPLSGGDISEGLLLNPLLSGIFGMNAESIYLSPAPLYHSAPLAWTTSTQSLGGTAVVMERFDPTEALALIERHRISYSQWVPTMFVRMLKLPEADRTRYDLSSHRMAVHAAAPCPVEVKRQMIEWWGPILSEYYAGTEFNGFTYIDSKDWLAHPGSVGRPLVGVIHICDDEGRPVPTGEPGTIYFERDVPAFEYHNDPEKTRSAQHPDHPLWTALGDVGYVDDEGFLYLTDRKAYMIISGGVNIYPQEIEDCLVMHPKVADVAVFGVPNEEMGEEVKAVVQPVPGVEATLELARELSDFAREHIAHYKVPRSIDFRDELPRLPTGKLYKRLLRDEYWGDKTSRIV